MFRSRLSLSLLLLAITLSTLPFSALSQSESDTTGISADAGTVARGLEVYKESYCTACHALAAAGAKGIFGPPQDAIGVIAGARILDPTYHGAATTAEGYIRESITSPEAYRVPGYGLTHHHMPAYTSLSEDDLNALVTFLLEQTGSR